MRSLSVAVAALALLGCGGDSDDEAQRPPVPDRPGMEPRDAGERGVLRVEQHASEHARRSGRRYVEGTVPYVRVATSHGKTALERGFPRARVDSLLVTEQLPGGRYGLETYVRRASGAPRAGALGPPVDRCRTQVELPGSGSVTATIARTPGRPCTIDVELVSFADLVSLGVDDARAIARERGFDLRVVARDGRALPVTLDLRFDRLNVGVEDGRVTSLRGIG